MEGIEDGGEDGFTSRFLQDDSFKFDVEQNANTILHPNNNSGKESSYIDQTNGKSANGHTQQNRVYRGQISFKNGNIRNIKGVTNTVSRDGTSETDFYFAQRESSTYDQPVKNGRQDVTQSQSSEFNYNDIQSANHQVVLAQLNQILQQTMNRSQSKVSNTSRNMNNSSTVYNQNNYFEQQRSPKIYQSLNPRQQDIRKEDQNAWESRQYSRVTTHEQIANEEQMLASYSIQQIQDMRRKWLFTTAKTPDTLDKEDCRESAYPSELHENSEQIWKFKPLNKSECHYQMVHGVVKIMNNEQDKQIVIQPPGNATDFFTDVHDVDQLINSGPVKSFAHQRLTLLEQKFQMYSMLNAFEERQWMQKAPHRDFYNVRKIDTHIHHSACMHQKHLLRFIKKKLKDEPDQVVIFRDGKYLTLKEVFESLGIRVYDLNVDTMDMHADQSIFHRFDKFNNKYNPCGQSRLREIFIKQENLIQGKYLAQLTAEVFDDLKESKYQHTENRISIYGRKAVEWDILANWICRNRLYSDNNIWLIQIPRLYQIYKKEGLIENFQQMLDNIFLPLFEVTHDPSSHPDLHIFLSMVTGFDMVDDESKPERRVHKHMPDPGNWNNRYNPAFTYYTYYIYANLYTLNKFREMRGLNSFSFRPHSGESGELDHLISCFLSAYSINHGINLRKSPGLQYCYYLEQIGLAMSPLSNNTLFLDYHKNPFPIYFARGLNVSLSTDDPVQIHLTQEPLVEEYSVAAQVWRMSSTDLCEVARNSVLQSGFPHGCKKHWVGNYYWGEGPDANDINKTNVPNMRLQYRHDTLINERILIQDGVMQYQESSKR